MARYRIISVDGDELGTGRYNDWFKAGDEFHYDSGQRLRVITVDLFEDDTAELDGVLIVEPLDT